MSATIPKVPSAKHLVYAGAALFALVIICMNPQTGPETGSAARARQGPATKQDTKAPPSSRELVETAFLEAKAYDAGALPEDMQGLLELGDTFTYSKNGGWLAHDMAAMETNRGFLVDVRFSMPLLHKALLQDSCGSFSKARQCGPDELEKKLREEKVCALLRSHYSCTYAAFDAQGQALSSTAKMTGQSVAYCSEDATRVRLILGPMVAPPTEIRLWEEGPRLSVTGPVNPGTPGSD